ncbi:flavin reductase family protein [Sphingobium fluviale]|uniref:Flavin reductase n=1 Tax=Sphingobium fluviale TaxID=2506423 RepID=A0A4V1N2V8_9SPHN|nr:flavin reductase family protein [Sphingobium fluviale]RXR23702.1 flavin reductase [Sphingobium fluviale]
MVKGDGLNPTMMQVEQLPETGNNTSMSFLDAMACLATGVAVVACVDSGHPKGLLVSSLTPLSVDPPSMLFCIRKAAYCYAALSSSDRCSIAILSEADQIEAERFSRADRFKERFDSASWILPYGQPPELKGALISMSGNIDKVIDAGTHDIFIVNIDSIKGRSADPLVYFKRRFQKLANVA